jgi:nicotinamidase-related amidase
MAWARYNDVPIVSTCDLYRNGNGNGQSRPGDCHKVSYTLRPKRISFTADNTTDLPSDVLHRFQQVIFEKRSIDPFEEPRIDRLLTEMRANEFIVIGAAAEGAVQATVLGLIQRHKNVTVVSDAIGIRDMHDGKMALRKMEAKGAAMVDSKKIAGISRLHLVGACGCDSCQRIHIKGQTVSAAPADDN